MKRTVFISSTYEDLQPHRKKIWELLEQFDVTVRGMERFGARKETPLETCLAEVTQSDIYIGIIAYRLGSIESRSGKSYTQLEYEKALELGKEIFIYLADEKDSKIYPVYFDKGEKQEQLDNLKSILRERHTIDTFINDDDLEEKLKRKFREVFSQKDKTKVVKDNEYQKALETLNKFLLVPKAFSGKEIQLRVKFNGEPFPASKAVCSSFNLDYGKTIGIEIEIIEPTIKNEAFDKIFIDYKMIEDFWRIKSESQIELLAKCQFSEQPIKNLKANFVEKSYIVYEDAMLATSSVIYNPMFVKPKVETIKAEGQIILVLTRFMRQDNE
jgi:tetratricopeptide (TPR) repeat protein